MDQEHSITVTMDQFKVIRRLTEATGYLELGMPTQSLATLARIPDETEFAGAVGYLRGHALWNLDQRDEAIASLRAAAEILPDDAARQTWFVLSRCYRTTGQAGMAAQSLARARALAPKSKRQES